MIDMPLVHALLKAVPDDAAPLLGGDIDPLPSVGPGQVPADGIGLGAIPVVRLTGAVRQAARSRIIATAHRINQGQMPDLTRSEPDADLHVVPAADFARAVERILALVRARIPGSFGLDPVRDIPVLSPMNRGGVGARALNVALQAALNLSGAPRVGRLGSTFAPGDKVMQVGNEHERDVVNGDLGLVERIDLEASELIVRLDGRLVTDPVGKLDVLQPADAMTVHKAQRSDYPAVVIRVLTQHDAMLQRNLLYTGVTRGKRLVVLVGQAKAIAMAVRKAEGRQRWSQLRDWLQTGGADVSGSARRA